MFDVDDSFVENVTTLLKNEYSRLLRNTSDDERLKPLYYEDNSLIRVGELADFYRKVVKVAIYQQIDPSQGITKRDVDLFITQQLNPIFKDVILNHNPPNEHDIKYINNSRSFTLGGRRRKTSKTSKHRRRHRRSTIRHQRRRR